MTDTMTVGMLKAAIEDLDDDLPVRVGNKAVRDTCHQDTGRGEHPEGFRLEVAKKDQPGGDDR